MMKQRFLNIFQRLTLDKMLAITFGTGVLILAVGSSMTGGMETFIAWTKSISSVLLVVRLTLYIVTGYVGFKAHQLYRKLGDEEGVRRMTRLLVLGGVFVAVVEVPKILWG